MALTEITAPTPDPLKKLILYGPPKTVKTPLALAYGAYLRSKNPKSRTIYIASDMGSEGLPSLPDAKWREFITVIKPSSPLDKDYDPYKDAVQAAQIDWHAKDPNIELVVWDTLTRQSQRILQFVADMGWFGSKTGDDKHVIIGDPKTTEKMALPVMGDYKALKGITWRLLELMLAQKTHVILITHEEDMRDDKGITRIGPATVGQAMIDQLPGAMTGVLYTERVGELDTKTSRLTPTLYVYSDTGDDKHIAGVRHEPVNGDPRNPIPKVKVGTDLTKYWELFFNTLFANETPVGVER